MLFTSKIREAAKAVGLTVQATREPAALVAAAAAAAKLVIVDLRLPTALDALSALAGDPATKSVRSVGFIDHEKLDVMDQARERGCGQVMAKGQFANALPRMFAALAREDFRDDFRRAIGAAVGDAKNFAMPAAACEFREQRLLKHGFEHRADAGFLVPGDDADGDHRRGHGIFFIHTRPS